MLCDSQLSQSDSSNGYDYDATSLWAEVQNLNDAHANDHDQYMMCELMHVSFQFYLRYFVARLDMVHHGLSLLWEADIVFAHTQQNETEDWQ